MNADIKAVEATVRTYLDGLYEGDAEKLAHVFHPTSALTTAPGPTGSPAARKARAK